MGAIRRLSWVGGRLLAGAATLIALGAPSGPAAAATAKPAADKEIFGIWLGVAWAPGQGIGSWKNTAWAPKPAFTEWGASESKRLADPQLSQHAYCDAGDPVGLMTANPLFPMQIASSPGQILITMEGSPIQRRIYIDGRKHPAEPDPSFFGHSIGHWEGEVLVVDTVGVKAPRRPLNGFVAPAVIATPTDYEPRYPISDQLHMVERLRLVGGGQLLEEEITLTDPKAYANSFSAKFYSQRRADLDIQEYFCNENPRPDAEGYIKPAAAPAVQ